jgi:hypothetical protein
MLRVRAPVLASALALAALLAGCGGGHSATPTTAHAGGPGPVVCHRLLDTRNIDDIDVNLPARALQGALYRAWGEEQRAVEPPAEIADAWRTQTETMAAVGDVIGDYDVTDPAARRALEARMRSPALRAQEAALVASTKAIRAYTRRAC